LWDANDLLDYWQEYPPTHVLVAAYLTGGKKRSGKRRHNNVPSPSTGANFAELTQAVFSAGGSASRTLPAIYKAREGNRL
jgi:hypothetical protein